MFANARIDTPDTIARLRAPAAPRPALVSPALVSPALVSNVMANAPLRADRLQFGPVSVDFRCSASARSFQFVPGDTMVHIVVPLRGAVCATTPTEQLQVQPGSALLLVRREHVSCTSPVGAACLILHLPRMVVQAQAFAIFGEPRRIAGTCLVFDCDSPGSPFGAVIATLTRGQPPIDRTDIQAVDLGQSIVAGLVDVVQASDAGTVGFAMSGSVKRAIDHLRAEPDTEVSPEQLARVAGVTLSRLRRNFKECLGITLAAFLQQERLDWARHRLASSTECRSIAELALACGMSGSGVFTRVYQRRFEETPTQTRTRAFALRR